MRDPESVWPSKLLTMPNAVMNSLTAKQWGYDHGNKEKNRVDVYSSDWGTANANWPYVADSIMFVLCVGVQSAQCGGAILMFVGV